LAADTRGLHDLQLDAAVWLHPAMLQLIDSQLAGGESIHAEALFLLPLFATTPSQKGIRLPMAHPQLAAAAGQQPDNAKGAQVAAALQQVGVAPMQYGAWSGLQ
jgi:hypothetical protein